MISGASVGSLLLAGIVPALMMTGSLMLYVAYISKKRNYPAGEKYAPKAFLKMTIKAFPALLTTIILLVSLYTGICTATEGGAIASLYCIAISMLLYRTMDLKKLWAAIKAKCHPVRQHNSSYLCRSMLLIYNRTFRAEPDGRRFSAVCYQQQIRILAIVNVVLLFFRHDNGYQSYPLYSSSAYAYGNQGV